MPLQRIDLQRGRSPEQLQAIADAVHQALVEAVGVPAKDRFQVISQHDEGGFICAPEYLGVEHQRPIFIQITLNAGRTVEQKQALYRRMADLLGPAGVPENDVIISLVEVTKDCWSFGEGRAQYVPAAG